MALCSEENKARIRQQVEFYFSDSNLPIDTFLRAQVEAEPSGFVGIDLLCTFKRMTVLVNGGYGFRDRTRVPAEAVAAVAEALRGSAAVAVSEDGARVRRTAPLPELSVSTHKLSLSQQTLAAEPFPWDAGIDALWAFFAAVGDVKAVRLHRHEGSRDFSGAVSVEFGSKEEMEKVMAMQLEYAGAPLRMQTRWGYIQQRMEKQQQEQREFAAAMRRAGRGIGQLGRGRGRGRGMGDPLPPPLQQQQQQQEQQEQQQWGPTVVQPMRAEPQGQRAARQQTAPQQDTSPEALRKGEQQHKRLCIDMPPAAAQQQQQQVAPPEPQRGTRGGNRIVWVPSPDLPLLGKRRREPEGSPQEPDTPVGGS